MTDEEKLRRTVEIMVRLKEIEGWLQDPEYVEKVTVRELAGLDKETSELAEELMILHPEYREHTQEKLNQLNKKYEKNNDSTDANDGISML